MRHSVFLSDLTICSVAKHAQWQASTYQLDLAKRFIVIILPRRYNNAVSVSGQISCAWILLVFCMLRARLRVRVRDFAKIYS